MDYEYKVGDHVMFFDREYVLIGIDSDGSRVALQRVTNGRIVLAPPYHITPIVTDEDIAHKYAMQALSDEAALGGYLSAEVYQGGLIYTQRAYEATFAAILDAIKEAKS